MRMIGTQTQSLNFVAFAKGPSLRKSIARPRHFDPWEIDSMAATRPTKPTEQPFSMVQATSNKPRGWTSIPTCPLTRPVRSLWHVADWSPTLVVPLRIAVKVKTPTLASQPERWPLVRWLELRVFRCQTHSPRLSGLQCGTNGRTRV